MCRRSGVPAQWSPMTTENSRDTTMPRRVRTEFPAGVKIALVALLVVAIGGIWMVVRVSGKGTSGMDNSAIEQLIPRRDDKILQQEPIGIDLASGYEAQLALNGIPIPDDEVDSTEGLDIIQFVPGPGKSVEAYSTGQNCVVATYWRLETGREQNATISWCFTVF